jgi:hypothetical protein
LFSGFLELFLFVVSLLIVINYRFPMMSGAAIILDSVVAGKLLARVFRTSIRKDYRRPGGGASQ